MTKPPGADWRAVWRHIDQRREDLGWSLEDLYKHTRLSEGTYGPMRRDGRSVKRRANVTAMVAALGWTPDSVDRILGGGEPVLLATPAGDEVVRRLDAVQATLAEMAGLLADLVHKPPVRSGAHARPPRSEDTESGR